MMRDRDEAQKYHNICKQCKYYRSITDQCKICNCIMLLKTKLNNSTCPEFKWPEDTSW